MENLTEEINPLRRSRSIEKIEIEIFSTSTKLVNTEANIEEDNSESKKKANSSKESKRDKIEFSTEKVTEISPIYLLNKP